MGTSLQIIILTMFLFFSQAVPALAGTQIIINKATNQLQYLQNGTVIKTFPVATGRRLSYTPEGDFTVALKLINPYYGKLKIPGGSPRNPLGVRWLGLSIGGGSVYGIHGTNNPSSIGTYASGGCIRMHNNDVIWLYDHTPIGTQVRITSVRPAPQPAAKPAPQPKPQPEPVTVVYGESQTVINNPKLNEDGQLLLPLRQVFEQLGYSVFWDADTGRANLRLGDSEIIVDYTTGQVSNGSTTVKGPVIKLLDGSGYGSISLWQQTLTGADIRWEQATRTITITMNAEPQ